jgi:hypothetical protein
MSESLKKKIREIARRLAEEEMSKRKGRAGIVAFGMKREREAHGRALIDNYGLDVVSGGKRRVGRPRKHKGGIIAYGMDNMMEMEGERMERKRVHHRKPHSGGIIAYGMDEDDMSGERMMHHRKSHRGRSLIDTYGLEVEGGKRTYHKVGKEYVKRTRAPSKYNMHVKEYLLRNKGATIADAAREWRNRK